MQRGAEIPFVSPPNLACPPRTGRATLPAPPTADCRFAPPRELGITFRSRLVGYAGQLRGQQLESFGLLEGGEHRTAALKNVPCSLTREEGQLKTLGRRGVVLLEVDLAGDTVQALRHESHRDAPIDNRVGNRRDGLSLAVPAAGAVYIGLEPRGDYAVHGADRIQIGAAID